MTTRPARPLLAAVAVLGALAACGGSSGGAAPAADDGDVGVEGTVTVFAAASLTDAFADVAAAFEDEHPGVTVELSFAGSPSLREQVLEGAPADVVATADEEVMADLVDEGAVGEPVLFATSRLQLAVPAGNPAGVTGLDDLARDELLVGLCAEGVPCGELARRVLAAAGITPAPDTEEPDVRALLAKIEAGELDAGLVYTTDVRAASGAVEGIDVPAGEATTRYPIATVADAPHPDAAAAFVAFVTSPAGRDVLADHGFGPP
jgi:molybdate transport system substrate-binding protein